MSKASAIPFTFRQQDSIGDPDAEMDHLYLSDCFVDPGILAVFRDCDAAPRILLGRTGSGKTALLYHIRRTEERVCEFNPETLSLNYIANSTILPFLFELGVNLDIFFDLLWRHVLASELIRNKYAIRDAASQQNIFSDLLERFSRDDTKRKALEYLRRWQDKFWLDADTRVKELTEKLEKAISLQTSVTPGLPISKMALEAEAKKSEEQRWQVVKRCQYVINQVQASDLAGIVDLLSACLDDDEQKRYFVLIDKLDDNWVDNTYKAALIRGLVRSVRAFQKVRHAKVIVVLRHDLMERVFEDENLTTQREKYENMIHDLRWTKDKLTAALDERISKLVRSRYSASAKVSHKDIMVGSIGRKGGGPSALDYIIERTLMRPRDLIQFFNLCIREAGSVPLITGEIIRRAEREYSISRLNALAWEWKLNYPNLMSVVKTLLVNRVAFFSVCDITEDDCINIVTRLRQDNERADRFRKAAEEYNTSGEPLAFKRFVVWLLYCVGLVGLKMSKSMAFEYAFDGPVRVSEFEINEDTRIAIHKCFWRALGIREAGDSVTKTSI